MATGVEEKPKSEGEAMRRVAAAIRDRLPMGWTAQLKEEFKSSTGVVADGVLEIASPRGERAYLILEAKLSVVGRDIAQLESRLHDAADHLSTTSNETRAAIVAPYLSMPVRKRLTEADLSYADLTGNVRIELSEPGLFIMDKGADADPWRGPGRPRGTLKGEPAARVVRALSDIDRAWTMRELIDESGASTGAAYRVIEYLEREGHVERDDQRRVHVLDWLKLLRAWSADYSLTGSNRISRWIAPRGIPNLLELMADPRRMQPGRSFRYAITGTIAAAEWAPYAPASMAMVYVSDTEAATSAWGLHPTESGANTLLVEPPYDVMLERTTINHAGLHIAAPTQVAVDLLGGPGRSPAEAEKLLEWMQSNEEVWRKRG